MVFDYLCGDLSKAKNKTKDLTKSQAWFGGNIELSKSEISFPCINANLTDLFCPDTAYNPFIPNDCISLLKARKKLLHISNDKIEREILIRKSKGRINTIESKLENPYHRVPPSTLGRNNDGLKVAHRIMERFGWKPGSGLGKNEQGITTAPTVYKLDEHSSVVITKSRSNSESGKKQDHKNILFSSPSVLDSVELLQRFQLFSGAQLPLDPNQPKTILLIKIRIELGKFGDYFEDKTRIECAKYRRISKLIVIESNCKLSLENKSASNKHVIIVVKTADLNSNLEHKIANGQSIRINRITEV